MDPWDNEFIDVDTGEVKVTSERVTLRATAIGSCVAVAIYNRHKKIGGLAHVMLPGKSPKRQAGDRTKYAEDALDDLFDAARKLGAGTEDLEVTVAGAANLLGEGDIPKKVLESVLDYLKKTGVEPKAKLAGGTERRSVSLHINTGRIFYTEGNGAVKEL